MSPPDLRDGLCRQIDPAVLEDTFFYPGPQFPGKAPSATCRTQWAAAKAVCQTCPVLLECREAGVGEPYDVWGGMDQYERHLARRRAARVAKEAREAVGWTRGDVDEAA